MPGFYYTQSGYPLYNSQASSTLEKAEFQAVQAGFDKLPTPTGFPNALVKVKADQSGLDLSVVTLTSAGALSGVTGVSAASGTWDLTGALLRAPTAAAGTNTDQVATTAFVTNQALTATLPGQGGNAGKFLTTDGNSASWASAQPPLVSGVNIKTVNGSTLLGSGDLVINVGTMAGPVGSVDGEVALFSGTTGQVVKRATASGLVKLAAGVLGTAVAGTDYQAAITASGLLKGSGTAVTAATAGTDFVAPGTATNFTSPQRPSLAAETAPASNALTWDLTTSSIMRVNLNANIATLTLTGTLSSYAGYQYQLLVRYNGGTSITWPAAVKFSNGTNPVLTGTSGKLDIFNFVVASNDGGSTFFLLCTGVSQNL